MAPSEQTSAGVRPAMRLWPDYRTVWRWHFYAGLICIPFIIWLSATGSIYLFKPQIETWLDRPYDHIARMGPSRPPSAQVHAALSAAPGTTLRAYELPPAADAPARVILSRGAQQIRVLVRPDTLQVLRVQNEDDRPMRILFRLHGELLAGDRGSNVVELAACWAIVMLITGLYLWWPRGSAGLAGVVWPRTGGGSRLFWRDLHAVTGVWVSAFALFLLLTGLPWADNWGNYLRQVRRLTGTAAASQDWTSGRRMEMSQRRAGDAAVRAALPADAGEHAGMAMGGMHMSGMDMGGMEMPGMEHRGGDPFAPLDRMAPVVAALGLPAPVSISPPTRPHGDWTAKSDTPNRPQRVNLTLDPDSGRVSGMEPFSRRHWIDQVVGTGVAAHEGQLFGPLNQALGVFTALGLILMSVSAGVMWWRRRPDGELGAPAALKDRRAAPGLFVVLAGLCLYLPLLGVSLLAVLVLERLVLRNIPSAARWLGLRDASAV